MLQTLGRVQVQVEPRGSTSSANVKLFFMVLVVGTEFHIGAPTGLRGEKKPALTVGGVLWVA